MKIRIYIYASTFVFLTLTLAAFNAGIDKDTSADFAIDYPRYLGWTIDSIIEDIGYPPEDSQVLYGGAFTGDIKYIGCSFGYWNGARIEFRFEHILPQPAGQTEIMQDVEYFMNYRVDHIFVAISCHI